MIHYHITVTTLAHIYCIVYAIIHYLCEIWGMKTIFIMFM